MATPTATDTRTVDASLGNPAATAPPAASRRRRRPRLTSALRWLSPLVILGLWQLASATGVLSEDKLESPWAIAQTAWDLTQTGELTDALVVSLRRAAQGLLIGSVAAIVLGAIAGLSRIGDAIVDPPMQMIRTLPLFGLVPLFILWFGIGEKPKIALVALGVVIPL